MPEDDSAVDRRRIVRALGVGAVGALLGIGTAQGAQAASANRNPAGASQPVVLFGPDGRALPTFNADDPGNVRSVGRGPAVGYTQLTLTAQDARTVRRAPAMTGIWLQVEHGEVRVRTDGSAATSAVGEVIGAGFAERYDVASLSVIGNGADAVVQTWSE